jgi:hypothetical protein
MLWRGKSGRMADGERVMSTARAALSVSLRALFSASLQHAAMSCSAHSEPMSTQQRASADCARVAIGDLSSASAEKAATTKKNILWQTASSRIETLSRDCTCMDARQFGQEEANALSSKQKPTMRGG